MKSMYSVEKRVRRMVKSGKLKVAYQYYRRDEVSEVSLFGVLSTIDVPLCVLKTAKAAGNEELVKESERSLLKHNKRLGDCVRRAKRNGAVLKNGMYLRRWKADEEHGWHPCEQGGMVRCFIYRNGGGMDENGRPELELMGEGESVCLPHDSFVREQGADISLNYAIWSATKKLYREEYS